MHNFLLKIVSLFRWVYKAGNVDYDQLHAIVKIKLMMDNRRHIISFNQKNKKDPTNTILPTLLTYMFLGIFIGILLSFTSSLLWGLIIFFSYIMVMIAMTLITDFSSILLDTSDNTIILPRPVASRTLFAARLTHILLYLTQLTFGLSIIPLCLIGYLYGMATLGVAAVAIILSVITTVSITNAFYLLILQYANEERLKNIITYFQILMAVLIMGSYQIIPSLMRNFELEEQDMQLGAWALAVPPAWMAGLVEGFHFQLWDPLHIALAGCALFLPFIGAYAINRFLTPVFSKKIALMDTSTTIKKPREQVMKQNKLLTRLSSFITSSTIEQGAFQLVFNFLGRDRKIKLKIYPSFGYMIVLILVFLFRDHRGELGTLMEELVNTKYHLMLIYMIFIVVQVALHEIPYTDDYKASWIYYATPIEKPGDILLGSVKAVFVRLLLPAYLLIALIVLFLWKSHGIVDLTVGLLNNFIMLMILALINTRFLPLSQAPNTRSQTGNFARTIITLLLAGGLGVGHYILSGWQMVLLFCIPFQLIVIYVMLHTYRSTKWNEIKV